jgi:Flp pilus assembly protein TadG
MDAIGRMKNLNNKGVAVVLIALMMVVLVAFVGLAVDVGYMYVAKGQLQNAADAGALAGAGKITLDPSTLNFVFNNNEIRDEAKSFVKKNIVAAAKLTDADIKDDDIKVGYWNLDQNPPGIQPTTTVPKGKCSISGNICTTYNDCTASASDICLIRDVAAVQVTLKKSVPSFFTKVVGWNTFSPAASAVAVRGYPVKSGPGLFPVAITKCMADYYFAQNPLPNPPKEIVIWGPYGPEIPNCNTGQWTSLILDTSDVPSIRDLMDGTIPSPNLSIGDNIWIQPGTKTTIYQTVEDDFIGKTVILPVVADAALSTHSETPITGFATFKITGVIATGSNKQIIGNFMDYSTTAYPGTVINPGGATGNIPTPPVLVK